MTAIHIEGLRKVYGAGAPEKRVNALNGLFLDVPEGTVFGFLGPNGAGKTTTIRLLTGLAHPTSGAASVAGIPISDHRRLAEKIGYLPEEPRFYSWMTPVEFLDHVGRAFRLPGPERKQRVADLIEQAGLAQAAKRRIAGFSRGMRQRLGLAQALLNRPEVLLLDEPVSALDPAGRKEMLETIAELRGQCTVFMSTHILADVERICDTIGILDRGRLVIEAPQAELLARYTLPVFELESEPDCRAEFQDWAKGLSSLSWVDQVALNGASARVVVSDLDVARRSLLGLVVQAGLVLRRYEIVTPSLEDIFLHLVGQEKQA